MLRRKLLLLLSLLCPLASLAAQADRYSTAHELYAALRDQAHTELETGGGRIDVVFADGAPGLERSQVLRWIDTSARALTTYFGRFPVHHVGILVLAKDGKGIGSGVTYGFDGPAIRVAVGRESDVATFRDDWVLVHEMTHLALPTVPHESDWLLEGNATYVEPIARCQAGQLDPAEVWRWSLEGMPKGLPGSDGEGLDHTAAWGRVYWGGALYWLLADVQMRTQTGNRRGVQDALRAINRASGGNVAQWTVADVLRTGDRATGTTVLMTLYDQMKATPVSTDLPALFQSLGVRNRDGHIEFDDHAPLAAIRRAITAPRPASTSGRNTAPAKAIHSVQQLSNAFLDVHQRVGLE